MIFPQIVICGDDGMEYTKLKLINQYKSESINPSKTPERIFEIYSVPIYDTGHPEYLLGKEIASNKVVVQKDDILLCKINPRINRVWVVADESEHLNIASSEWIVIRNSEYNPEFLAWYFRSTRFKQLMVSEVTGIGGSLTRAQPKAVAEYPVPILLRKEQDAIVNNLNKISYVMKKRRQELSALDELIKARFVEMFGDYEWSTTVRNYIAELRGGKSLAGTEPCKNKVLKTGAATFGWFDPEQYKYLPQDYEPLPEHKVETGDVMISRMNTPDLVGACSYVFKAPEDMYYPDRLWKVIPKNQANPIFIWQLLWDPEIRRQIKDKSGGTSGTMHNISKLKLLDIKCIDVPVSEQNKFADFVKQVDKSKVAV